ncbi:MAG: rod shape-determining protein MreC [Desulfuromonadaceae bacterium]|nr:rod shape-determining protein MreC [Desulfuromonadaceae bacterium]
MLDWLRKFRKLVFAVILLVAALLFYSYHLRYRNQTTFFEKTVLEVTAPLQKGADYFFHTAGRWWDSYLWLVSTAEQNRLLLEENRRLRARLQELDEVALANERLQRLLEFRDTMQLSALVAQVFAEDSTSWFRTVVINKGSADGVEEGMPVMVAEGVVGRILRVAPSESRVLLVTDPSSALGALVQKNRARGIIRGQGGYLTMEFTLRQKDIQVGDLIVTSGGGGVFPSGLPVGHVVRVGRPSYGLFQSVTVLPTADFFRLEEVMVLRREQK